MDKESINNPLQMKDIVFGNLIPIESIPKIRFNFPVDLNDSMVRSINQNPLMFVFWHRHISKFSLQIDIDLLR